MKLAGFDSGHIGVVEGPEIIDITDIGTVPAGSWPPVGMVKLIADFATLEPRIRDALKTRPRRKLDSVRLESPVQWPNKLIAYPTNYHDHIAEMNSPYRSDSRGFFFKANSSISGPADPIVLPALPHHETHHESELAVFISKTCRDIPAREAMGHVFGYACLVDVSVRGSEERVMRKSYDSFCPIGPWIVTADEVPHPDHLDLHLSINGVIKQQANTRDLIMDIPNMIAVASSVMTLYPGDIIATGTPGGVGRMVPGDKLVIEIERVGRMELDIVQGKGGNNMIFDHAKEKVGGFDLHTKGA